MMNSKIKAIIFVSVILYILITVQYVNDSDLVIELYDIHHLRVNPKNISSIEHRKPNLTIPKDNDPKKHPDNTTNPDNHQNKNETKTDHPKNDTKTDPKTDPKDKYTENNRSSTDDKPNNTPHVNYYERVFTQDSVTVNSLHELRYKRVNLNILCKLKASKRCFTNQIADVIDRLVAVSVIYKTSPKTEDIYYKLFDDYCGGIETVGIPNIKVEAINKGTGDAYKRTRPGKEPLEMQAVIDFPFYVRENLINFALKKLDKLNFDWEYALWIDVHQYSDYPYWWEDVIYKLEKYKTLQIFQELFHLEGPKNQSVKGLEVPSGIYLSTLNGAKLGGAFYFGNAWAINRETYLEVDYIMDNCVAMACDVAHIMSCINDRQRPSWYVDNLYFLRKGLDEYIFTRNKIYQGKAHFVRGRFYHLEHPWWVYYVFANCINANQISMTDHLYRDEDFILHIKEKKISDCFKSLCNDFNTLELCKS